LQKLVIDGASLICDPDVFSGGLDDGGESGLLGDFSPSSPLHKTVTTTSQSPTSPPFVANQNGSAAAAAAGGTVAVRAAPGRLEFSPEKAGLDVTPLNLDFLDRSQPPPQPLTALAGMAAPQITPKIYFFISEKSIVVYFKL
jgi:hypothetical protein